MGIGIAKSAIKCTFRDCFVDTALTYEGGLNNSELDHDPVVCQG